MSKLATIGDNRPPSNYDTVSTEINDLYDEAKNWADGQPVENQGTADQVETLIALIKEAVKKADTFRKEEVQPYDEAKAKIQERYNTLIGKTKALTGKAVLALEACQQVLTPWKQEQQRQHDETARIKREEAERLQREADEALKSANLNDKEHAQELTRQAQQATKEFKRATKDNIKGLHTVWDIEIVDEVAAFRSIWKMFKPDIMEYVHSLAKTAVRNGKRNIEGFNITERKVAKS